MVWVRFNPNTNSDGQLQWRLYQGPALVILSDSWWLRHKLRHMFWVKGSFGGEGGSLRRRESTEGLRKVCQRVASGSLPSKKFCRAPALGTPSFSGPRLGQKSAESFRLVELRAVGVKCAT